MTFASVASCSDGTTIELMEAHHATPWVQYLSDEECWALLRAQPVGRVGVLVDSAPEMYPVNYAVDGRTIVFRTEDGTKLRGLDRSPSVCFEIDGFDAEQRSGWSVLVKGHASEVAPNDTVGAVQIPLDPWAVGEKGHWVRITARDVTGRRVETR